MIWPFRGHFRVWKSNTLTAGKTLNLEMQKQKKNSSLCKYQALIIFLKWRNHLNLQKIDINSVCISLIEVYSKQSSFTL